MSTPQEVIDGLCEHLRPLYEHALAQGARVREAYDTYGYVVRLDVGPVDDRGRPLAWLGPVRLESLPMQTYGHTRAYTCTEHDQQLGYDLRTSGPAPGER